MKKFKKLFLSAAMLGSLCVLGAGLTTNAAVKGFQEDFNYVGDGTIDFDTSTPNKWIDTEHKIVNASLGAGTFSVVLNQVDDADVLEMKQSKDPREGTSAGAGEIEFRNGSTLISSTGESVVIKTRIKASCSLSLYERQMKVYTAGKTYVLLKMRGTGGTSSDKGMSYKMGDAPQVNFLATEELKRNEWHDFVFVLKDNGDLNEDNTSSDKIYAYMDGELLYESNFNSGDNFTGTVSSFTIVMAKSGRRADDFTYIDYLSAYTYNGATIADGADITKNRGDIFDLAPNLTKTDSESDLSIPEYTVTISDPTKLKYENGKFEALALTEGTPVQVTFTMLDKLISGTCTYNVTIENSVEPIPVTDIDTHKMVSNNTINLGIAEQYTLSNLFTAVPSSADNTNLDYTVSDETIIKVEEGILKGVAAGTATLTVTAPGGTDVSRVITINVVDGPYDLINSYEIGKTWEAETTFNEKVWQGKIHNTKEFCPISSVEDELFGKAIKFVGTGAVNKGGSHLDLHIPYLASGGDTDTADDDVYYLNWDKDYKLTGYIKTDVTTATSGKFSIKVIGYAPGKNGAYYFNAPYKIEVNININNNGWMYFESDPINFDYYAMDNGETYPIQGFKIELGVWNVMEGVDLYASHLNLVELDTVKYIDWNLTEYISSQYYYKLITGEELKKSAGSTYQITALAVPSSAEMTVTYGSSDETLATVDQTGLVTFLNKSGKVTITATNSDGTSKIVIFDIQNTAQSITVPEGQENVVLSIGDTVKSVDVTITPADATSTYTVTVGDSTLCTTRFLNGRLQIVPLKVGTTTITIVANDNENATLTLTVTIKGYSITYNINGHGEAQNAVENVTALPQELPTLTAEGWVFGDWFLDADCTQAATAGATLTADITLYAKWSAEEAKSFKVTYNVNGHGTAPEELTNVTALPATLPTLTAEGWTFEGWYLDADCKTKAEAGKEITEDTTLYAKWTKKTDPVTPTTPEDKGVNVAAIVVPIVVVVVLAVAGVLVYFFVFKKKEPKNKE